LGHLSATSNYDPLDEKVSLSADPLFQRITLPFDGERDADGEREADGERDAVPSGECEASQAASTSNGSLLPSESLSQELTLSVRREGNGESEAALAVGREAAPSLQWEATSDSSAGLGFEAS